MASTYPASADSFDTIAADKKTSDAVGGRTHRDMHNDLGDAIEAVQTELGTDPAGASATVKARFEVIEANDWVTSARIAADAVGSSEIAANAVGASELADNAVDSAAIADGAVTPIKTVGVVQAKTANYTILSSDSAVTADTTSGAVTLTLPAASAMTGRSLRIIKTAGANTLTIQRAGSDTILPSSGTRTSVAFPAGATFGEMELVSNGTAWYALGGQASDESVGSRMWKWEQALAATSTTAAVGWQMVYADTGWRNISALVNTSIWTPHATYKPSIRRVGNTVTYAGRMDAAAAWHTASFLTSAMAVGFRPVAAQANNNFVCRTLNSGVSGPGAVLQPNADGSFPIARSPAVATGNADAAGTIVWIDCAFLTNDAWPASLPGA